MSIEVTNDIAQPATTPPVTALDGKKTGVDRAEIKRLAQQFEAMLMTQMLREMRRSMLDEEEEQESGFGAPALADTADIELGNALSKVGGVGLTDALLKAFEHQVTGKTDDRAGAGIAGMAGMAGLAEGTGGTRGVHEALNHAPPTLLPAGLTEASPISSAYGWRQDPLTGAARFHHGIDIAVAYGRDVKVAADGTVTFAGVQNGYGNTVIVDHADGRQTRYAHLSEELVRAGDVVTEGQVLGKTGNSGRSTGPHLHFELLVNGRPVDPTPLAD